VLRTCGPAWLNGNLTDTKRPAHGYMNINMACWEDLGWTSLLVDHERISRSGAELITVIKMLQCFWTFSCFQYLCLFNGTVSSAGYVENRFHAQVQVFVRCVRAAYCSSEIRLHVVRLREIPHSVSALMPMMGQTPAYPWLHDTSAVVASSNVL